MPGMALKTEKRNGVNALGVDDEVLHSEASTVHRVPAKASCNSDAGNDELIFSLQVLTQFWNLASLEQVRLVHFNVV